MWADQLFEYAWQKSTAYHEVSTSTSKLRAGLRKGFRKPLTLGNIPVDKNILPTFLSQSGKCRFALSGIANCDFAAESAAYLYAINNARKYILIERLFHS